MTSKFVVCVSCVCLMALICSAAAAGDCSSLNDCSGHGQCHDGQCVCHDGFGFDDCSMITTNCPSHCSGHGQCLNGTCSCDTGFAGTDCSSVTASCPNNCTGHGMCHQGSCICFPGLWSGEACDVEVYRCPSALNDCNGHGDCGPLEWDNSTSAWACSCDDGFCGDACDVVCGQCPRNCSGKGICTGSICQCNAGFGGPDCSYVVQTASCPNNCSGHGMCKSANATSFQCVCDDCYRGLDCSKTPIYCPGNCSGRGLCGCDGKCQCQSGFSGEACQDAELTCDTLSFCSGNGKCANGTCKCSPGFAGPTCSLACHTGGSGSVGCHADEGHGKCVSTDNVTAVCQCKPEYEGVGCQLNTTSGMLDEYVNGWNPIGTVVLALVGTAAAAFFVGLVQNFVSGKRGLNAVPGVQSMRSKVRGTEYSESLLPNDGGQRNETVY